MQDDQRVEQARAELEALGVTEIGTDHLRWVGRGSRERQPSIDQLCGHCARGKIAVSPDGDVWPCVFARWMPVGTVRQSTLIEILTSPEMASATATLADHLPVPETPVALTTKTTRSLVFVCRAYIPDALQPADNEAWPFTVPCVAELAAHGLPFTRPVTFLIGDNGSGNTRLFAQDTLIE